MPESVIFEELLHSSDELVDIKGAFDICVWQAEPRICNETVWEEVG